MEERHRLGSGCFSRFALLMAGLAAGGGLVGAHFTGRLTPIYHALGLHTLATTGEQSPNADQGHTGHEGMAMPGMPGMSIPQESSSSAASKVTGRAIVTITPERQQLIGVRTGKVRRGKLLMDIQAVGIIEPDQTRMARIQTRISGWVTKLHVNFVGQNVKKGDLLLELYSPDLLATQEEYLLAVEAGQKPLAASARRRLELWGIAADDLKEMERTKKARETLTIRATINGRVLERNAYEGARLEPTMDLYRIADLSVVWLQAKVYEYELPHIEIGQPVRITLLSRPESSFQGKVSFVEPILQEITRTVNVRVAIDNPRDEFKPGMYANLKIDHEMGEGLLVPESALLRTGERNLAFRVLGEGRFEPVEVKLGSRFKGEFEVLTGLSEGDEIVTSAGFLIDAESRLKSATGAMTGHQHGSSKSAPPKPAAPPKSDTEKKPGGEHDHMHMHGQKDHGGAMP